jgi:hypothetical protein
LMAVSMFVIIFSIHYKADAPWLSYVSIACIGLFIAGFAPGLGPIAGLLPNELFRQEARSTAVALAQGVQWGCNLLLCGVFVYLLNIVGKFVFAGFLVLLVASIIFFYIYMPETKNKTFDEIQEALAFGRYKDHKRYAIPAAAERQDDAKEKLNMEVEMIEPQPDMNKGNGYGVLMSQC